MESLGNDQKKVTILGCPFNCLSMNETINLIENAINTHIPLKYTSVDAGKLALMQGDDNLYMEVLASDIIGADGLSLVWLSRFLDQKLPEKISEIDLMENIVKLAHKNNFRIYFLGGRQQVLTKIIEKYISEYSSDIIAGYRNGYFDFTQETKIAREIANSGAHILFVDMASPTNKQFLYNNRDILKSVVFKLGVGGAFDVVSGKIKRAPRWAQKACLEWLHRFLQEPSRFKTEVVDSLYFLILILRQVLSSRGPTERITRRSAQDHSAYAGLTAFQSTSKARFLGINFEVGSPEGILNRLEQIVYHPCNGSTVVMHANLHTIYTATKTPHLKVTLEKPCSVILFEGIALTLAKFLTSLEWWPDVSGTDLVPLFLSMQRNQSLRLALVGGRPEIAEIAGRVISNQFPNIIIVETLNGFSDISNEQAALARVRAAKPDVLLLGLGTPLQEITATAWAYSTTIPLIWTVGGLFDLWVGVRKRAPSWALACRMEWLWRLIQSPTTYWRRIFVEGPWLLRQILAIWRGTQEK